MILLPTDSELKWPAVEESLRGEGAMAEEIWQNYGIKMPPGSSDGIVMDQMDKIIETTAKALGMSPGDVYPARARIRWFMDCSFPGSYRLYAAIDGGKPCPVRA